MKKDCACRAWRISILFALAIWMPAFTSHAASSPETLRVLFLGDQGHHRPADRFKQLQPVLAERGIELVYTDQLVDLTPSKLAGFDGLLVYANHTAIQPDQEQALLEFVARGGGVIPLHCASYCFHNSPKYIELVGAQFKSHGTGVFVETLLETGHPVTEGLQPVESWDESYVHTRHNTNRIVLAERRDDSGAEPWTWVREHGKGRVFYTAWGHDERTWGNAGFQTLVERGIRWACANSPNVLRPVPGLKPFEYTQSPVPLPNYTPNAQWGTQGEPIRTMQKPLDPRESMKHLVTFPEFEIRMFASEPQIIKPLWLAWDERGRLWIAESIDYPNELQPEGQGRDRLKICEDTDGDGRADTFTVFVEGLSIPTGFVFAEGGVIVIHSGRTELFRDTNGDDRADECKVLFEGWGMRDTHATASNLRYGFDNWIWGTVGYSGFNGTVGGRPIRFGQGIFRFKPDGTRLEFIRSSNNNTWGLALTEDNVVIGSTANGNASMYLPIPNRYYEAVKGWSASRLESIADSQRFYPITDKVRQVDWHDRYTAGSGSAIYTARSFPREYWNRAQFVAEPTGHLLGRFFLERRGADFVAHNARNLVASDDEWTSPIYAEVGPDGALWMVDWYNYIIQHNPTPRGFETGKGAAYETPLRDKSHGRIYRIVCREGKPSTTPGLRDPGEWAVALRNDNLLWRMHAQRLLVTRGATDTVPALIDLIRATEVDELGLNPGAIHALWTLSGLGAISTGNPSVNDAVIHALAHPSAGARRAAVTVLPRDAAGLEALLRRGVLQDPDAQVRLAALLALSEMPAKREAGEAIFAMLGEPENSEDRWMADAATAAAAKHDAGFLASVLARYKPLAPASASETPAGLIANNSFEEAADGRPSGWRTMTHGGRASFATGETGRTGTRSVKISSEQGADASWAARVSVKPRTEYVLTGWIRTDGVRKQGSALGALLNVHELQDPVNGATKGIAGTVDWTPVELRFNSGEMREVTINCLFGGWGRATGTAWFDDIQLAPGSELAGEMGRVVRIVTGHYARRGPVESILGTLDALRGSSPELVVAVLDGLVAGWPQGTAPSLDEAAKQALFNLMDDLPESARDRLMALSQRWGQGELFGDRISAIVQSLQKVVADASAPEDQRLAAAQRLVGLDTGGGGVEWVLKQVTLLSPPSLGGGFVNALTESRLPGTGPAIVGSWESYTPAVRRMATAALLRRGEWTRALLDAVEKGTVNRTDIAAEHWAQMKQNPDRDLARRAERLSASASTVSADREAVVKELLPLARQKGDARRGKEVFAVNCAVCHIYDGQGGTVGPDLTGVAARGREDILLEILDPNRSVEANYRLWTATTRDGEIFSGRLEAETRTTVEILDTTGRKHVLQRGDIASLSGSPVSIMPAGFEALPAEDLTALVEYLSQPHP